MRNSQSPSIQAIYQNALPYYLDRVDACLADDTGIAFAEDWLHRLLAQQQVEIQLNTGSATAEKFRHLYFESKNIERTRGPKTFGFGYPFIVDTHESELIIAPLFIWHLTLEPSQNQVDSWILRHNESHPVLPNYKVVRHLEQNRGIKILSHYERLALTKKIDRKTLFVNLQQLAEALGNEYQTIGGNIEPCPGVNQIGQLPKAGNIHWSGIFSLFPPQSIHGQLPENKPENIFQPEQLPMPEDTSIFHYLPTDPFQSSAIETTYREKATIVEGESASGKTQTIANLLINSLLNGKKCLVVSERVPSLLRAQKMLTSTGINTLNFLMKDAMYDKNIMLEMLRVAGTGASRIIHHKESDYQIIYNQYVRLRGKMEAQYAAVHGVGFGKYDWTETVGLFLQKNSIEGKELLSSQLSTYEFNFSYKEYEAIKNGIQNVRPVFEKIKTLRHPLDKLHPDIFTKKNKQEGLTFIHQNLKEYEEKSSRLHHQFITKIDRYATRLRDYYEAQFEAIHRPLESLLEKIARYTDQFGDDFKTSTSNSFNFLSISNRKKQLNHAREEVAENYQKLVADFEDRHLFDFEFQPAYLGKHIPNVRVNLQNFKKALRNWRSQIISITQEEVNRLNGKTVNPDISNADQIGQLEEALAEFVADLNQSGLYKKPIVNQHLTIPGKQKMLESIQEQLEQTRQSLRDHDLFYEWQTRWLALSPLNQKVVRAIVKVKPKDWSAAFESWFLNNVLVNIETEHLPTESGTLNKFAKVYEQLRPMIVNKIRYEWHEKQQEALRTLKRKNKKVYNRLFGKSNIIDAIDKHPSHVWKNGWDAVTAFFPVFFTTPFNATHVLPAKKEHFDLVIFDEANRMSVETANAFARLGKRLVIVGSDDTFGNETSLLQYARENEVPAVTLQYRYHPNNTNIVNPVQQFDVTNLEGRFNEKTGINDVEAQHIIRLLNQVQQTEQRVFPSVGIICFTIEQRDLISAYLLKIKQQNQTGADKIRQLERNGMGVFHIDELYGHHFDILMVSLSIGGVNVRGQLTKKVRFFNTEEGISHIKLLLHKAPQKTYLIHSISDEYIQQFLNDPSEEGTYLLANLIQLATYSEAGNEAGQTAVMAVLNEGKFHKPTTHILAGQIQQAMSKYFQQSRFQLERNVGKIEIPLVVLDQNEGHHPIAIHPDGFFGHAAYGSFYWEYQQHKEVETQGYHYLPLWSVRWWKNPEQQSRQLASSILKIQALPDAGKVQKDREVES